MEKDEYQRIYDNEAEHWWYVGLRELVHGTITRYLERSVSEAKILDAGCGGGKMLEELGKRYEGGGSAVGIDLSPIAIELNRKRGAKRLVNCSVCALPFLSQSFDAVISLDVIYHMNVDDDIHALKEFERVLNERGILILNLAAHDYLRGPHDDVVRTRERYTVEKLRQRVRSAGFTVEMITYRNSFLFPALVTLRTVQKMVATKSAHGQSDLKAPGVAVNKLLKAAVRAENALLSITRLPFGSSVFCVARKAIKANRRP